MPKSVAQFTGIVVTSIIVFGTDMDVYCAMPLGILAGALATFFVALADQLETVKARS
ncbi:MAG: hypothetical protein WDM91_18520 [Rhizomicrobium sp.]